MARRDGSACWPSTRLRTLFAELFAWFDAGKLQPLVDRVLPLHQFADALRHVEGRAVIGKVVLRPGDQNAAH